MMMLASQSSTEMMKKRGFLSSYSTTGQTDTDTDSCLCTHGNKKQPEQLMFRLLSHWSCLQKYLLMVDN